MLSGALERYFRDYLGSFYYSPGYKDEDETWSLVSLGDKPWVGLYRYHFPERRTTAVL
ncbi:hypothetical protein BDV12DRAFT_175217 [Aspergillus spectabilis]